MLLHHVELESKVKGGRVVMRIIGHRCFRVGRVGINPEPNSDKPILNKEVGSVVSDITTREITVVGIQKVRHILSVNDYEMPIKVEKIGADMFKVLITVRK